MISSAFSTSPASALDNGSEHRIRRWTVRIAFTLSFACRGGGGVGMGGDACVALVLRPGQTAAPATAGDASVPSSVRSTPAPTVHSEQVLYWSAKSDTMLIT